MNELPPTPLRVAGVPEHFNLPWRQRAWLRATQPWRYAPIDYREAAEGTGAMTRALANNEVDVAVLLTEGAALDIARGGPYRVIKVYVNTPLEWGIHVAANGPLLDVAAIRGHRYAISRRGSGSHVMAAVHAASQDWPTTELNFVQVDTLEGARRALPGGDADVFFWEKTMTHPYVEAGEFRRVGNFHSPWPSFVVCATNRCIAERREELVQLMKEINTLCAQLQNNTDAATLISNAYGISVQAADTWLDQTSWNTDLSLPLPTFQVVVDELSSIWPELAECRAESLCHPL
ncbi:MAG: ABC transporter substrate-binding protein [Pseudomonadota bacterium]